MSLMACVQRGRTAKPPRILLLRSSAQDNQGARSPCSEATIIDDFDFLLFLRPIAREHRRESNFARVYAKTTRSILNHLLLSLLSPYSFLMDKAVNDLLHFFNFLRSSAQTWRRKHRFLRARAQK
jgi:hypothetical protein